MNKDAYRFFTGLSQDELDKIFTELLAYAINLIDRYYWRYGVLPAGIDPQDIVQRIVIKTLSGKFNWDPSKIDLYPFMKGRIWSETTKLFIRKEYKHELHASEGEDIHEVIDRELSLEETVERDFYCDPAIWLDAIENEKERAKVIQEYIEDLLEACQGKPELEEIVYAILDGCEEKPRFLAEWLKVSVDEVNNRLKRLRSRADRIIERRVTS